MEENVIDSAIQFFEKIKAEDEVTVKFRKLDGAERVMRCTLNFSKIPNNQKPKDVNMASIFKLVMQHKMVHVYDLDRKDWRTVPFDRSEWIETKEKVRFRIKK
jgi:hypothetical protein